MEPLRIEATISSISREVSGKEFNPLAVYFKHPAPESIVDHEAYFECPVHFSKDRDALLVSHEALLKPNKIGDQSSALFCDTHLEAELPSLEESPSLVQHVLSQISQSLSEGVPTIFDTAQQLGMSGRTLQRRLSEQGYYFQTLVDESRRQLSESLLQETDYSLAEIAFMTGYSEQSAFTRAFKRWAGQTPRSYRLNVLQSAQKIENERALSNVWQAMSIRRTRMLVFIF
ncbi:MAG: helix-turn-helix domain-containing protein [Rhodothermales bacterium]